MKALIISGGTPPSKQLLMDELKDCDFIICADSGADFLYECKVTPNFLVGDFDSVNKNILEYFSSQNCIITKFPKDKDYTDTELAFNLAKEKGADSIILLGATGSRIDHLLGNLGILSQCIDSNIRAYLRDDNNTIYFINKSSIIKGKKGSYFTVQAFGETVKNVSITGAKFPLSNYNLVTGDPLTISNEFLDGDVGISFDSGKLMILQCKD